MNNNKVIIVFLIAISIPCSFARNKRDFTSAPTSTSKSSSTETSVPGRRSASTSTSSTSSSSSSETEGADNPEPQGPIGGLAQECTGDACVPLGGVADKDGEALVDPPVIDVGEPVQ